MKVLFDNLQTFWMGIFSDTHRGQKVGPRSFFDKKFTLYSQPILTISEGSLRTLKVHQWISLFDI